MKLEEPMITLAFVNEAIERILSLDKEKQLELTSELWAKKKSLHWREIGKNALLAGLIRSLDTITETESN